MPLKITVPEIEVYDEKRNEFVYVKEQTLSLEHSLVSISKWEAKWQKPFLSNEKKTEEESRDYIRCMTLTQNVDPAIYAFMPNSIMQIIYAYVNNPMTATTFREEQKKPSKEVITSELVYYWMTALNIDIKCEKWHFNRLLTLIRVCNIKNTPPKKYSKSEWLRRQNELNASRRRALHTKG